MPLSTLATLDLARCTPRFVDLLSLTLLINIASVCKSTNASVPYDRFEANKNDNTRPINTYNRRGTTNRRDASAHAVAYTTRNPPALLQGEHLDKEPIKVNAKPGQSLDPTSRINFGKTYTVEHNVLVLELGKVDDSDLHFLRNYWFSLRQPAATQGS
jgi:hypothetical protein